MKRHLFPFLIAVLAAALFTGLLYVEFYETLDSRLYDLMLRIKPGIEEDASIILLEVDDQTISEIDIYPLPRDIFADGLILTPLNLPLPGVKIIHCYAPCLRIMPMMWPKNI